MNVGKSIGDLCPHCLRDDENVRLVADAVGYGTISHLVCRRCSSLFAATNRGQKVEQLRIEKVEEFENPLEEPTHCATCSSELAKGVYDPMAAWKQRRKWARQARPDEHIHDIPYLFCGDCNTIAWRGESRSQLAIKQALQQIPAKDRELDKA